MVVSNIVYFHPKLEVIQFGYSNIFQMGWFKKVVVNVGGFGGFETMLQVTCFCSSRLDLAISTITAIIHDVIETSSEQDNSLGKS